MPKILIEAINIEKYFGDQKIFSFDNLKIYAGDKIGIIGANGSGKTTLLNILSGDILPDKGNVNRYCQVSFIKQFGEIEKGSDQKQLKEFKVSKQQTITTLSGGEKARIKIASALKSNALIFADEPTSNLDFNGIELLLQKLNTYESFLLVSHDRNLIDRLCNKVIEIKDNKLIIYKGNYSFYLEESAKRLKNQQQQYENYIEEKIRLEKSLLEAKQRSKSVRKAPSRMGNSEARLHKGKTAEKRKKLDTGANQIKNHLEKLEVKEKPMELPKIKMDFSLTNPPSNKILISSYDLSFSYENKEIFKNASFEIKNSNKTAIYGENGSGKTTLLNLINEYNKNINIVPKAKLGYFYQGFENIELNKSVLENALENSVQDKETVRLILARLLFRGDTVFKPASVLSGGERIKLSLAKLLVSDANILLLDEPTNYLDMPSTQVLQALINDYEGTVLFVSHDKDFVNNVADNLLIIQDKKIISFEGNSSTYENSQKEKDNKDNDIEKISLQMKITEIISKLSSVKDSEKAALESEYNDLIKKLKTL